MDNLSYTEPVYLISAVAEILSIHPQTLRQYEREGLIKPSRTQGRVRLYSQKDIDEIKELLYLTRELGINLAGADMILKLQKRIRDLEEELDTLKNKISKKSYNVVPNSKAITISKSLNIVVVEEQ